MLIASEKKKKIKDKENLNLFTRNDESTAPPTGTLTEPTTTLVGQEKTIRYRERRMTYQEVMIWRS